ncbi:hypothetical protein SSP35_11_01360 [Streptomyces sp. NBRC 110611]|uniref:hypothetical protein n=1 Tax=Streptomyces sp. NBRC 110611 TaxID=1621259 RepID=UPI000856D6A4|nr:hypothetical protein [Streptomyces sp. NBRC 110611]GAU69317.1 hypothetical protein SSP35_11_01360 [Streptomyces sp. NBRC 110611]
MSRSAKSSTAGSAGVVLCGSRNSLGDEGDGEGDEERRFDFWGLRDMRLSAFLEQRKPGSAP